MNDHLIKAGIASVLALSAGLATAASAAPLLLITEIQSNQDFSDGEDWFEITNFGDSAADLSGWVFTDEKRIPANGATLADLMIQPGQSVVFVEELTPEAFRAWWGIGESVEIVTYSGSGLGLGRGDEVALFDAEGNLQLALSYAPEGFTKSDGTPATTNLCNEANPSQLGHSGQAAGACDQFISLVLDPGFGTDEPRYTFAEIGKFGAFQAANGLDVGSPGAVVPVPAAAWLFLSAVGGLAGLRRLRKTA